MNRNDAAARRDPGAAKRTALRDHHGLNPHPESVTDPVFAAGGPFFDARDLVQVKYEMLRSVRHDGRPASAAARAFGFSRPSFYQARATFERGGLPALLPQRPGPKRAHKLSDEVLTYLDRARMAEPSLGARRMAELLRDELGLTVHPRSIERALGRRAKKAPPSRS